MDYNNAKVLLNKIRTDNDESCYRETSLNEKHKYDIDVIIPCYNVEKYIEDCIRSAITQNTSFSYRIIAINDGSNDSTMELLKKFESNEKVILLDQENRGVSATRNRGLEMVEAEYVLFLDSDDILLPDSLEKLTRTAKTEKADYVQGGIVQFMDGSAETELGNSFDGLIESRKQIVGIPGGKLFKASLFKHLRFPDYYYEDSIIKEIVFDLAKKKVSVSEPVYKYRINLNGISGRTKGKPACVDSLWINLKMSEDRVRKFGLEPDQDYYEYKISTYRLMHNRVKKNGIRVGKAVFVVYSNYIRSFFDSFEVKDNSLKKLERALKNGNYFVSLFL